ncbi:28S ribosomal protein S14, mitochondrial [Lingula anatina]|uniref:28S ribosomal protein S14, mitochondrial n=1 Tax=Lingula anatina TaxID=7574 RepID=A0A1S3J5R5_LINAN|nr:28S ribosomal protein S14, mitochondrial [Lingula anatina]|eukprot:XP_013405762.1 28S ribosomal protein S14, mitochondrial [Lingula anatina]
MAAPVLGVRTLRNVLTSRVLSFPAKQVCVLGGRILEEPSHQSTCVTPVRSHSVKWAVMKDAKKRETVKTAYSDRLRLNCIRKNTILPKEIRHVADEEIAELPRNSNPIRIVARCVVTGTSRGIVRRWRMHRIPFRRLADENQLSGVTRSIF